MGTCPLWVVKWGGGGGGCPDNGYWNEVMNTMVNSLMSKLSSLIHMLLFYALICFILLHYRRIQKIVKPYSQSMDMELQQRSVEFMSLFKSYKHIA